MMTSHLRRTLRLAGLTPHIARQEARRIRRLAHRNTPAQNCADPGRPPMPSEPLVIFDSEMRRIGRIEPVGSLWRAWTRAGIRIGTFETASAAGDALAEHIARYRSLPCDRMPVLQSDLLPRLRGKGTSSTRS